MIDHPVVALLLSPKLAVPKKNHDVVGKLLHPGLIVKKQIAGLGFLTITTNELGIEIFETARVANSEKVAICYFAVLVGTEISAEEFFA